MSNGNNYITTEELESKYFIIKKNNFFYFLGGVIGIGLGFYLAMYSISKASVKTLLENSDVQKKIEAITTYEKNAKDSEARLTELKNKWENSELTVKRLNLLTGTGGNSNWTSEVHDVGIINPGETKTFLICPSKQNARFSINVASEHKNVINTGAWDLHYIHTTQTGKVNSRNDQGPPRDGRGGNGDLTSSIKDDGKYVLLTISNTPKNDPVQNTIVMINGYVSDLDFQSKENN
ncbi:hypothetical protein Pan153_30890 [Gimesia panareensis]|uniref:Uncharacterized protein n=1 Tax=Gimesia panareensis TaxID=2527978 RepID=A0A518FQ01_9PLAN|nr:hypothetical protein [Gimesia panareensis]QDV18431.1 hypothetical protein Pan153_30890 [Gimesia panareensis]